MTVASLVDAGVPVEALNEGIASLGLQAKLVASEAKRHGFRATYVTVEHEPEHAHRHLHHITDMIDASRLTPNQKELAKRIFTRLGEAEAKVHGTTIRKVHFHEVGAVDSIADIVGAAIGFDLLGVEAVVASPIPTGHGTIEIAHGRCSIPAPATAELLTGIPIAASNVEAELTTPTGAAIIGTIAQRFGPLPAMNIARIGYGAGTRELTEQPNILRLVVGETGDSSETGQVWTIETNLDDISAEVIGYAVDRLWSAGALDVTTAAIQMKKNRPGVRLTVLCNADQTEAMQQILFEETGTLGVRRWPVQRQILRRMTHTVETPWGAVEGKLAWSSDSEASFSPEYESCRRIALEHRVPLRRVYEAALQAYRGA